MRTFIEPNIYESGRATVTVYNWAGAPSVRVSLANLGLANGDRYEVRDVQNYLGDNNVAEPVLTDVYDSNRPFVNIPIRSNNANKPLKTAMALLPSWIRNESPYLSRYDGQPRFLHTDSEFNAFIIKKQSAQP